MNDTAESTTRGRRTIKGTAGRRIGRYVGRSILGAMLLTLAAGPGGCALVTAGGQLFDSPTKQIRVTAEYLGLANQTVAVVVNVPEYTFSQYPTAQLDLCWAVTRQVRQHVPGVRLIDPDDLIKFQQDNPYWSTLGYSELIRKLNVDRIVLVDVVQYSTHEPGNKYVMRGTIVANVGVVTAADKASGDPGSGDNLAFEQTVEGRYPQDNPVGVLQGDERTIEVATLSEFSRQVAYLFYDHKEVRE